MRFLTEGQRVVAIAGMGHAGTFGEPELRRLARNLTWAVAGLPAVRTICTVLIGSGEGTLEVEQAVRALFLGLGDALAGAEVESRIRLVRIVEKELARAHRIRDTVEEIRRADAGAGPIELAPASKIRPARGGAISAESGLALLLAAAAQASGSPVRSAARKAVGILMRALPRQDDLPARLVKTLDALGRDGLPAAERLVRERSCARATASASPPSPRRPPWPSATSESTSPSCRSSWRG